MALLAACATGNFTTAGTWALVDSTSLNNSEAANTALTTAYQTSSTFTPGAITIDGIGVKLANRTGTTGTMTVALDLATVDVAGTVVTINCSDLPAAVTALLDGGWIFFKFAAPVTLAGATAYGVKAKTSSSAQVTLFSSATTNWSRFLRTTTTQAPAVTDDMIITEEWTAAATGTTRTVTMDNTALTDFGAAPTAATGLVQPGIAISQGGTLTWGTTGGINYYMRMSNSIIVYNGGTYSQGVTGGNEIPRNSTAKLFFDCGADGDYGFIARNGSTINVQGLSRSSAKNVVSTKLTLDMPVGNKLAVGTTGAQGLLTATNATTSTLTAFGVDGYSLLANGVTDNAVNAYHSVASSLTLPANQKGFCSIWVARGSGTNNRYVRLQCGNTGAGALTNGFFADFDLSAVTASAYTNVGNGVGDATDVSTITAVGAGFLLTISGVGQTSGTSSFVLAACNALASPSYAGDATQNFIYQGAKVFQLTYTPTITIATPGVITATAHQLGVGAQVKFTTTGALPTGITASTTYYVCGGANLTANTFTIATSLGNAQAQPPTEIATTGSQSGTHTLTITAPTGTLTVNDDTGWLSGDMIAVASTSRTSTDSEPLLLTSAATSTTLPCTVPLTGGVGATINCSHSGSSPTQAEVILLTRNVVIAGLNSTLMSYVSFRSGSVVDIDWAEFYYIGVNANFQRGIDVEINSTGATNFSMQFSSIHDTEVTGFNANIQAANATLTNLIFSSNTLWNLATTTGPSCQFSISAVTSTNWTFDSNILIRTGNGTGWSLADIGGTFTNNTVAGAASIGVSLGEASATIGTMSGNVCHSNASNGHQFSISGINGTYASLTGWNNNSVGVQLNANFVDLTLTSPTLFGNNSTNLQFGGSGNIRITSPVCGGDTVFTVTSNIGSNVGNIFVFCTMDDGDLSSVTGIKTAATADLTVGTGNWMFVLRNTKLGAATEVSGIASASSLSFVASERHDQTAGNHKTWTRYGATTGGLVTDTTFFNTASPSMRMTPADAVNKLESATQFRGFLKNVASGASVSISVYIRKSAVGDGAAYNGNQPRLIQKANPALGQSSDVVIATYSAATGSWNQISGTSSVATDDGAWEFVVDVDGTTGFVNVDDWA